MYMKQGYFSKNRLLGLLGTSLLLTACISGGGDEVENKPVVEQVTVDAEGFNSLNVNFGGSASGTVKWKVESPNISFKVSCNTTGWVALGFNGSAQMQGADIVMGYYNAGTGAVVQDHYATGHTAPLVDVSSDITAIAAVERDGNTEIRFTRALDTQDVNDFVLTPGASTTMLLACAGNGVDNLGNRHLVRTTFAVDL